MEHLEKFIENFNKMLNHHTCALRAIIENTVTKDARLAQFADHAARYEFNQCKSDQKYAIVRFLNSRSSRYKFEVASEDPKEPLKCIIITDTMTGRKYSFKRFKAWSHTFRMGLKNGKLVHIEK